ncbi:MAG: AEC family transporter [Gammaproteobacteria bacterium]|nr:AEC family transporter [Gammaproteobacteria bacterium]
MLTTFAIIAPVFVLIGLGYWIRTKQFLPDAFWGPAEKLGYWILLPALLINSLATKDLTNVGFTGFILAIVCTIVGLSLSMLLFRRFVPIAGASYASIHQGTIRLNGLLAIAICVALLGADSLVFLALMVAAWVPLSNGLSVFAFVRLGSDERLSARQVALAVIKNPNVFSVFIGLGLNFAGAGPFIETFILFDLLGRAALPIGLLAVGAALNFQTVEAAPLQLIFAVLAKLIVMPMIMLMLAIVFELSPMATAVAVISASMPTSPGGYLIAQQLRGDAPLMASIITLQTLGALITVTLFAQYGANVVSP